MALSDIAIEPLRLLGKGRSRCVVLLLSLAVSSGAGCITSSDHFSDRGVSRPNILVIVTDDQRPEGMFRVMPKTRHWFKQGGVNFERAFVSTPLCCPSRASIFSGQYAHNHNVRTNDEATLLDQRSTVQYYLQDAGYSTAIFGKYLNEWNLHIAPPFFDEWAIFEKSMSSYYGGIWNVGRSVTRISQYSTDYIADRGIDFLQRADHSADEQPWLLYLSTSAAHSHFQAEPKFAAAPIFSWRGNPATRETDRSDKPAWVKSQHADPLSGQIVRRKQLRTLMSVDELVDAVFRKLSVLDEDRDTLAIFISDNGYLWGEHGLPPDKRYPYTAAVRVPLLLRWPKRLSEGVRDRRLASNVDVAPTVLDAAKVRAETTHRMDGKSLLEPWRRRELYMEHWKEAPAVVPTWASIRSSSYQYIEYYAKGDTRLIFREYYNLERDPWQLHNLLRDGDPSNQPSITELHARLARYRTCSASTCP